MEYPFELPLYITELESPEGFQVWEHKMHQYLIAADLWEWTKVENKDAPTVEIPALANDGSNQVVRTTVLTALEEKMFAWKRGNQLACNAIVSRLGTSYAYDFENETNAYKLWNRILRSCKPAGLVTLNSLYRRLLTHSLGSCKDAVDYTGQFKSIYKDILYIDPKFQLQPNFLIYLFHTGLGQEYQDYVTTYTQRHEAINDDKPAYSLEYAMTRFLRTVGNPKSAKDGSAFASAADSSRRPKAFAGPLDLVVLPAQANAVPGPNARTIQKLVNWCNHCEKPYHTSASCNDLTGKKRPRGNEDNKDNKRSKNRIQGANKYDKSTEKEKHRKKRSRHESSLDEALAAISTDSESTLQRWAIASACSQHIAMAKESFVEYSELSRGDAPAVKGIAGHRTPVGVGKVRLTVVVNGSKRDLILSDVFHIPDIPLNLISMGQLQRRNCPMTFITNNLIHGIEIGSRGITAWQQANNLYCLDLWEPKALPSADPRKLCPSNPVGCLVPVLAPESESSGSDTDTE